jgi:peptidoglycan/LPS O-acetylase OafA/YrhL
MLLRKALLFFTPHHSVDRIYGLDILRAAAIIFVVLLHGCYLMPGNVATAVELFLLDGVSIFFVLSGFLIGGILLRALARDGVSFKTLLHFWMRRWLRTLPAYYFVLALLILLPAAYTRYTGWAEVWHYFLFIQNFATPHPRFFMEAWSLSIEEWFYLLVPALIFFLVAIRLPVRAAIILSSIIIIAGSTAYRFYLYTHTAAITGREWELLFRKEVLSRLDSIMIGVIGAYLFHYHRSLWSRYKLHFLILGILTLLSMKIAIELKSSDTKFFLCIFYFTANACGTLFLLPFLSEIKTGSGRLFSIITFISIISYSMYLLHFSFIQGYALRQIDFYTYSFPFLVLRYSLYWIFTIIGAAILYNCIEQPFMKLRSKI